jgi:hypothetical protein
MRTLIAADARRKEQEQTAAATRSAAIERKALEARARGPPAGHFKQVMETCEPLDTIFDEIDLLEDDPPHRGVAMRNARFRPYWIQAEEKDDLKAKVKLNHETKLNRKPSRY